MSRGSKKGDLLLRLQKVMVARMEGGWIIPVDRKKVPRTKRLLKIVSEEWPQRDKRDKFATTDRPTDQPNQPSVGNETEKRNISHIMRSYQPTKTHSKRSVSRRERRVMCSQQTVVFITIKNKVISLWLKTQRMIWKFYNLLVLSYFCKNYFLLVNLLYEWQMTWKVCNFWQQVWQKPRRKWNLGIAKIPGRHILRREVFHCRTVRFYWTHQLICG